MKILIVGCGSIGERHLRNLKNFFGLSPLVFDSSQERLNEIKSTYNVDTFDNFDTALAANPNVVFVCVPNHLHIEFALKAAKNGAHIFVEKPLSHNMKGVDELVTIIEEKGLKSLVGCNMRFYPCVSRIKRLLEEKRIGKIYSANVYCGHYFPSWRPGKDYRKNYGAIRAQGGGVLLDIIHEIDYARWLFGDYEKVFCFSGKISDLEIDTEDIAEILVKFKDDIYGRIRLDYLQQAYSRGCKVVGSEGTINWDWDNRSVNLYSKASGAWEEFPLEKDYDLNTMYVDEIKHFFDCIKKNTETLQTAKDARKVLRVVMACADSSVSGKMINL